MKVPDQCFWGGVLGTIFGRFIFCWGVVVAFFENCCGVVFALLPPLYLEQNDMFSHVFIFI